MQSSHVDEVAQLCLAHPYTSDGLTGHYRADFTTFNVQRSMLMALQLERLRYFIL